MFSKKSKNKVDKIKTNDSEESKVRKTSFSSQLFGSLRRNTSPPDSPKVQKPPSGQNSPALSRSEKPRKRWSIFSSGKKTKPLQLYIPVAPPTSVLDTPLSPNDQCSVNWSEGASYADVVITDTGATDQSDETLHRIYTKRTNTLRTMDNFEPDVHIDVPDNEDDTTTRIVLHLASIESRLEPPTRIIEVEIGKSRVWYEGTFNNMIHFTKSQTIEREFAEDGRYWEIKLQIIYIEPVDANIFLGILPGDRLIAINQSEIQESTTLDDIRELINQSDSRIYLYVRSILELAELAGIPTSRFTNETTNLRDDDNIFSHEMSPRKDHLSSDPRFQKVWLVYGEVYAGARLLERYPETGRCRIVLEHDERELEVGDENIEMANPKEFDRSENLTHLTFINESSVLHVLRQRYGSNLIHTCAGSSLLVINPMAPLSIYSEKVMSKFHGCQPGEMPAHIFATAQSAMHSLETTRQNQVICLVGRSGAGKTTTDRHLLKYILYAAGSTSSEGEKPNLPTQSIHRNRQIHNKVTGPKLQAMWSILESFTCSRTLANTNASRCARLTTVELADGCSRPVTGLHVQTFLLERTRIVRRPEGEPTFHVFYQLLAGVDDKMRTELYLDEKDATNLFMTPVQRAEDQQIMRKEWQAIVESAETLGITKLEWNAICRLLAAIYHLGAAGAKGDGSEPRLNYSRFEKPSSAQKAALLLGVPQNELPDYVFNARFNHTSPNGGEANRNRTASTVSSADVPLPQKDLTPVELMEGCVTGLYVEVMQIIVYLINRSMSTGQRSIHTISILDPPGFQNPHSCGRTTGATFEDLCYNYAQERLHLLHHDVNFTMQRAKYEQENIDTELFDDIETSPAEILSLMDRNPQNLSRHPHQEVDNQKGLLWILDEEAVAESEERFVKRMYELYHHHKQQVKDRDRRVLRRVGRNGNFILNHCSGSTKVQYNPVGWLKNCREYPTARNAQTILTNSEIETFNSLSLGATTALQTVRRGGRISGPSLFRQKSVSSQVKHQMDFLIDLMRRSGQIHFIHCFLPVPRAGLCELPESPLAPKDLNNSDDTGSGSHAGLNVPLVRQQMRSIQLIESVRCYKQGYPEHIIFRDFRRRFNGLLESEDRPPSPMLDEREAVEQILEKLDLDVISYKIGLGHIFFRPGVLNKLNNQRNEKFADKIVFFQAVCRGYLARKKAARLKVEHTAIRCIQHNCEEYLELKDWSWWQLLASLRPLIQAQLSSNPNIGQLHIREEWRTRAERLERQRNEYKSKCVALQLKLEELASEIREEQVATADTSDLLESEREERIKLERELEEVKHQLSILERSKEEIEFDLTQARMWQQQQIIKLEERDSEDESLADAEIYKERYRSALAQIDHLKRQVKNRGEILDDEDRQSKKLLEKKLLDATADNDQLQAELSAAKRRQAKTQSELADMRLQAETGEARFAELERRQRRLDAEQARLTTAQQEAQQMRDRMQQEKDEAIAEKFKIEKLYEESQTAMRIQTEKSNRLANQIAEFSSYAAGTGPDSELVTLRINKMEMEQRIKELEDETTELNTKMDSIDQTRIRAEMQIEKVKQQAARDIESREAEIEAVRSTGLRRIRQLEGQLDDEREDRQKIIAEKRVAERQLSEVISRQPERDHDLERKLKRDLKKTKAVLKENQALLDQYKNNPDDKVIQKNLKDELDEALNEKELALRTKRSLELDIHELQQQVEELSKGKQDSVDRFTAAARERVELQGQLEDKEEEYTDLERKFKTLQSKQQADARELAAMAKDLADSVQSREKLNRELTESQARLESIQGEQVGRGEMMKLENRIRELEGRLELEQSSKSRVQSNLERLKEQMEQLQQERELLSASDSAEKDKVRRLQRQLREAKDETEEMETRLQEADKRRNEVAGRLEQSQEDYELAQADLRNALKKAQDLQAIIDEDMRDDSSEDLDDDESPEATNILNKANEVLRNRGVSPRPSSPAINTLPHNFSPTTQRAVPSPFQFANQKSPRASLPVETTPTSTPPLVKKSATLPPTSTTNHVTSPTDLPTSPSTNNNRRVLPNRPEPPPTLPKPIVSPRSPSIVGPSPLITKPESMTSPASSIRPVSSPPVKLTPGPQPLKANVRFAPEVQMRETFGSISTNIDYNDNDDDFSDNSDVDVIVKL